MKKTIFLSAMMVLCVALVAAAVEVDFTIKPEVEYLYNYGLFDLDDAGYIPSLEVGVSVMPQLDLVGRMAIWSRYEGDEGDKESWMIVVPGLGARYTFWENNNINTYAFGIYSFPILRYNGEPINFKMGILDLGLGGVCRLNENWALIGETGVRRSSYGYPNWEETFYTTKSSVGIRFYF
jgi:hypothetical protein